MTLQVETKFINPHMAEEMLATSGFNRPVSGTRVLTLADEMRTGKWQLNGESIIFCEEGKLLDGQHRLYAIVESGCTVHMMIVRGVKADSFETIDTGRSRSGGDVLAMKGYGYSIISSAAAAMIWRLYHGTRIRESCPPNFQLRVMERYPGIQKWVPFVGSVRAVVPSTTFLTALVYLEDVANKPLAAERFFAGIAKGADLSEGDPILALRNRMINMRAERHIMNATTTWPPTARVLTAIERGEHMLMLKIDQSDVVRRPMLWDEHIKTIDKRKRLDDIAPSDSARRLGGSSRAKIQGTVEVTRAKAKGA